MSPTETSPTFNLKVAVTETGVKADTLRAWERRYGLPNPRRTKGGHRLYSTRDIQTINWLVERQHQGMSISRAVELWRQYESEGQDPLDMLPVDKPVATPTQVEEVADLRGLDSFRQRWIKTALDFNEKGSDNILNQALAIFPVERVVLDLISQGIAEIGMAWYEGRVNVHQEHFATALAVRKMESMLAGAPPPTRPGRILAGCPPEETHTFGLLVLTLLLRRQGWEVIYLGARVPLMRFGTTIDHTQPDLVILSCQQLFTAAEMAEIANLLAVKNVPLAYGGLVFNHLPELRSRIHGHFLGETLETVPKKVEQLLISDVPLPTIKSPTREYETLLQSYREARPLIESYVWQRFDSRSVSQGMLTTSNKCFGDSINAALRLGDINFVGPDIQWVRGFFLHAGLPDILIEEYLSVYHQALEKYMPHADPMLIHWIEKIISEIDAITR